MSNKFIVYSCVIIITIASQCRGSPSRELPQEKCSLQNSTCLTARAGVLKQYFVEGVPEFSNETLEKIKINDLDIKTLALMYAMTNTEVEGLKDSVIDNLSINMEWKTMRLSFRTSFVVRGDYITDGTVFSLPIFGNGTAMIKMNDVILEMTILFDIVKNNEGDDVMKLKRYIMGFDVIGNMQYRFENLFNNDENESKKFHAFMHEYWRTIVNNYGNYLVQKITDKIFNVIKLYLDSHPLKDISSYYLLFDLPFFTPDEGIL